MPAKKAAKKAPAKKAAKKAAAKKSTTTGAPTQTRNREGGATKKAMGMGQAPLTDHSRSVDAGDALQDSYTVGYLDGKAEAAQVNPLRFIANCSTDIEAAAGEIRRLNNREASLREELQAVVDSRARFQAFLQAKQTEHDAASMLFRQQNLMPPTLADIQSLMRRSVEMSVGRYPDNGPF